MASSAMINPLSQRRVARSSVAPRPMLLRPPRRSARRAPVRGRGRRRSQQKSSLPPRTRRPANRAGRRESNSRMALPVLSAPSGLSATSSGESAISAINSPPSVLPAAVRRNDWASPCLTRRPRVAPAARARPSRRRIGRREIRSKPAKLRCAARAARSAAPGDDQQFRLQIENKAVWRNGISAALLPDWSGSGAACLITAQRRLVAASACGTLIPDGAALTHTKAVWRDLSVE